MRDEKDFDRAAKRDLEARLKSMNKRLGRDVEQAGKRDQAKPDNTGFGNAFRLSSEFVSAILVGAAIGYAIDWLAGTKPWAMILFLMLGFVAGVLNVLRAAGELSSPVGEDRYKLKGSRKNDD